ncbi:MAG: hypothetical protein CBB68_14405 [Rhodospirillaceae bacterium TMED8]|nr:hypothetical protein [Magnetovibrio sp.]OUT48143.1 MAG: hypothetical protein CBB68_14405 [Rhodospirillaceae bacterium TMED8]
MKHSIIRQDSNASETAIVASINGEDLLPFKMAFRATDSHTPWQNRGKIGHLKEGASFKYSACLPKPPCFAAPYVPFHTL